MKRTMMIGIAGGVLALALAGGAIYAKPKLATASAATAQATATPAAQPNAPKAPRAARPRKAVALAHGLVKATADATQTRVQDVTTALKGGQSLSQYAQAHGQTDAAIIGAARATLDARLKQAVANGKLTQARADAALQQFDTAAPTVMADQKLGAQLTNVRQNRRQFGAALVKATADATSTTAQDVTTALKGGQSLSQYAQAHGKSPDDIIAKLREQGQARLAQMLERARGLLDKPGLGRGTKPASPTATPAE